MAYVYNTPYIANLSAGSSSCIGYADYDGYLYVKPFNTYFSPRQQHLRRLYRQRRLCLPQALSYNLFPRQQFLRWQSDR